ncbi:MAG: Modulator of FtsH protease HflK [Planctomycetes bacterium ADurb.Bin412]|nr:MAG: Modulator of FtsH protease HflK [Planctomycetes bacterium ADurb.Bin412]
MSETEKEIRNSDMSKPSQAVVRGGESELDPGNKALAEALRISFVVLKIVMICVIGFFVYGGLYKVEQNERAVVLRFGRVVGGEARAVQGPGFHWAWPYPIEEIVKIPASNTERKLAVRSFWYHQTAKEMLGVEETMLNPRLDFIQDGYSLTASKSAARVGTGNIGAPEPMGLQTDSPARVSAPQVDYNLVHSKWIIRYQVTEPLDFVEQLWDGTESGWANVETLLVNVLSDAVIGVSANRDIDWMIWDAPLQFREDVRNAAAKRLEELEVGVTVGLDLEEIKWPRQVRDSFDKAASANIEANRRITEAKAQENEIVSAAQADGNILMAEAEAYRSKVKQSAQADEKYLREILVKIEKAARERVPEESRSSERVELQTELLAVTLDQLYQEAVRGVIEQADETMVLNSPGEASSQWRLQLSRDKNLEKKKRKEEEAKTDKPVMPTHPLMKK